VFLTLARAGLGLVSLTPIRYISIDLLPPFARLKYVINTFGGIGYIVDLVSIPKKPPQSPLDEAGSCRDTGNNSGSGINR
jgi:hypothetical protein